MQWDSCAYPRPPFASTVFVPFLHWAPLSGGMSPFSCISCIPAARRDTRGSHGLFSNRYNVGILSSVLVHPGFDEQLHEPSSSDKGLITAIYYLGTWLSYVFFSRAASDVLGRRYAALVGTAVACVGTVLMAAASGRGAFAMVIGGRIISGLGVAVISTSVPLYQR